MTGLFGGGGGGDPGKKTAKVQKEIYGENKALLTPFITPALGAQSAYAELLGLTPPGGSGASTGTPSAGSSGGGDDSLSKLFGGGAGAGTGSAPAATPGGAGNAFQNYLNSTGHQFRLSEGSKAITNNNAVAGLLNSGSTLKDLLKFGQGIGTEDFTNYMNMLSSLTGSGLSAAGSLAGVGQNYGGQVANTNAMSSQYKQQQGQQIGNTLGSIAQLALMFSDRRLKYNVVKISEFDDGLGLYSYSYGNDSVRRTGVMADEVAKLRPWALGPVTNGYATVNYGAL